MSNARKFGELRIISGKWKGRRFPVLNQPNLRPTPDRIRETVFNWIQQKVVDARCLDLFAGSGALGLEALSRGASHVTFIDNNPAIVKQLKQVLATFQADNASVLNYDVRHKLTVPPQPYDIIFLDPPFGFGYLPVMCETMVQTGWLNPDAYIYMESELNLKSLPLPPTWNLIKEKIAGNVHYRLIQISQAIDLA